MLCCARVNAVYIQPGYLVPARCCNGVSRWLQLTGLGKSPMTEVPMHCVPLRSSIVLYVLQGQISEKELDRQLCKELTPELATSQTLLTRYCIELTQQVSNP